MKILKLYLFCLLFLGHLHAASKPIKQGEEDLDFFSMSYDATFQLHLSNIGSGKCKLLIQKNTESNSVGYSEEISHRIAANFIEPSHDVLMYSPGVVTINYYYSDSDLSSKTVYEVIVPELANIFVRSIYKSYYSKDRSAIFFTLQTSEGKFLNFVLKLLADNKAYVVQVESIFPKASCLSENGEQLALLNLQNIVNFYDLKDVGTPGYYVKNHFKEMSFNNRILGYFVGVTPEIIKFLPDQTIVIMSKSNENEVVIDNFNYQNEQLPPENNHISRINLGKLNLHEQYSFKFSAINDSMLLIFSKGLKIGQDLYDGKVRIYEYLQKKLVNEISLTTTSHNQEISFSEYGLFQLKYLSDRYALRNKYFYYVFSLNTYPPEDFTMANSPNERNLECIRELAKNGSLEKFTQYGLSGTSAASFMESIEIICNAQDDQMTIECLTALKIKFNGDEKKLMDSLARVLDLSRANIGISLKKIK